MSLHPRKMLKEVSRCLEFHGISVVEDTRTKRHRKLKVTDGRKTAIIIISVSPSDHRTYRNITQTARCALREAP